MKKCSECKVDKSEIDFYHNRTNKDGLTYSCKKCFDKRSKRDYQRDKEKLLKRARFQAKYTPEGRYTRIKSSAKVRDIDFDLSLEDFKALWNQPCAYCGEVASSIGIDRIDSTLGYFVGNIAPCCISCNYMKRTLTVNEFVERCQKIVNFNLAKKGDL